MDRILRLSQFWNWLPAFRVIAELESIHQAAARTRTAPSSLSRKLRLLEHALGHALFDRVGRGIRLNTRGRELLAFVRDAMRLVDDGFVVATSAQHTGVVRVSCLSESVLGFFVRAFAAVRVRHPGLVPAVERMPDREVNAALLDGRIDLALVERAFPHGHVRTEHVANASYGIYRARAHPLERVRVAKLARVLEFPFVAPPVGEDDVPDHWPAEVARSVAMVVPSIHAAIQACSTTQLLTVLPDALADETVRRTLVRVRIDLIAPVKILAVRRPPLRAQPDTIALVIDAVREAFTTRSRERRRS